VQHPQVLPSYYRSLQKLCGTVGGTGDKILLGSNGEESKVRVEQRNKRKPDCSSLSLSLNYSPPLLAAILVVVFG
jgi:hypothetical protein